METDLELIKENLKEEKILAGNLKGNHSYYSKQLNIFLPKFDCRSFNKDFVNKL